MTQFPFGGFGTDRIGYNDTFIGDHDGRGPTPYFVLIERAMRDEGTSYHYLPPSAFADAPDTSLLARVEQAVRALPGIVLHRGATWTTVAPYRETEAAIARAREAGALAVEMEAAALYGQPRFTDVD